MTTPDRQPLGGRVVLVTGAGGGIGRAVALRCAREGAVVVLAGRSRERLGAVAAEVADLGRHATVVGLDQREERSVEAAVAATLEETGGIDVLVANSGVAGPSAPLWQVTTEAWEDTLAVNVTGTFLVLRAVAASMVTRRTGSIVVIGSTTGKHPLPGRTPYATSKTALVGLVRTAATDLGPYGIRVNLVSPGPVAGERLDRVVAARAAASGASPEQSLAELTAGAALGRVVTADEVAEVVAFLASDRARGVTGEDVNVSAGAVMH